MESLSSGELQALLLSNPPVLPQESFIGIDHHPRIARLRGTPVVTADFVLPAQWDALRLQFILSSHPCALPLRAAFEKKEAVSTASLAAHSRGGPCLRYS